MIKKLFSIFNIKTKIESLLLFILNIIISILDIISIGSIPIFLYYALEKDKLISKIPFEKAQSFIDEILKNNSDSENLFLTLSIIVLIFVIKNIFIFLVNIYQVYFGRKIKTVFTAKTWKFYKKSRFSKHLTVCNDDVIRDNKRNNNDFWIIDSYSLYKLFIGNNINLCLSISFSSS